MTARPASVLAHGLGGSTDLPIPYAFALVGAAWALTFKFAVVAFAWRRPRFDPAKPGRPLPQWVTAAADAPLIRWAVAVATLVVAAWIAVAGFFGPQNGENALPGVFYVLLWVGLVAISLAVGPVWRVISPVRTVYRLLCLPFCPNLVERGQQTVIRLADPLGRGWHPLGLDVSDVNYILSLHPSVLAKIKVGCVVAGHVAAVIAAHDRALRLLPPGHQLTGQLAMMLVMVGYTFIGLYLLFGG